jgi:hypothetical protein
VAKVVGAVEVDRLQQGTPGAGEQRPPLRLGVGGGGAGGGELGKGAVERLIVPPLPAASRPSNTITTRSPLSLTQYWALTSSTWSARSSRS